MTKDWSFCLATFVFHIPHSDEREQLGGDNTFLLVRVRMTPNSSLKKYILLKYVLYSWLKNLQISIFAAVI